MKKHMHHKPITKCPIFLTLTACQPYNRTTCFLVNNSIMYCLSVKLAQILAAGKLAIFSSISSRVKFTPRRSHACFFVCVEIQRPSESPLGTCLQQSRDLVVMCLRTTDCKHTVRYDMQLHYTVHERNPGLQKKTS